MLDLKIIDALNSVTNMTFNTISEALEWAEFWIGKSLDSYIDFDEFYKEGYTSFVVDFNVIVIQVNV